MATLDILTTWGFCIGGISPRIGLGQWVKRVISSYDPNERENTAYIRSFSFLPYILSGISYTGHD